MKLVFFFLWKKKIRKRTGGKGIVYVQYIHQHPKYKTSHNIVPLLSPSPPKKNCFLPIFFNGQFFLLGLILIVQGANGGGPGAMQGSLKACCGVGEGILL